MTEDEKLSFFMTEDEKLATQKRWQDTQLQAVRLVSEIMATQEIDMPALCESMDLEMEDISELMDRIQESWEQVKWVVCPPDPERYVKKNNSGVGFNGNQILATYTIGDRTVDVVGNWDDDTSIDYDFFDLFEDEHCLNLGEPLYTEDNQTPSEEFVKNFLETV